MPYRAFNRLCAPQSVIFIFEDGYSIIEVFRDYFPDTGIIMAGHHYNFIHCGIGQMTEGFLDDCVVFVGEQQFVSPHSGGCSCRQQYSGNYHTSKVPLFVVRGVSPRVPFVPADVDSPKANRAREMSSPVFPTWGNHDLPTPFQSVDSRFRGKDRTMVAVSESLFPNPISCWQHTQSVQCLKPRDRFPDNKSGRPAKSACGTSRSGQYSGVGRRDSGPRDAPSWMGRPLSGSRCENI